MSFKIMVNIEDNGVQTLLANMHARLGNLTPAMNVIGEIVQSSAVRNFEESGRPNKWKPSKRALHGGKTLIGIGIGGGLMGSISYRPFTNKVEISANKKYAAIHQFGGKAGRGLKVNIPARPYMLLQDEDWVEIKDALKGHLIEGAK